MYLHLCADERRIDEAEADFLWRVFKGLSECASGGAVGSAIGCLLPVFAGLGYGQGLPGSHVDDFSGHPRVIVISDIGNEPDDQMSFVRLLLYSNELDIEGMIAATSTWQKTVIHPETMRMLIEAYGQVRPNLLLNAKGWPNADELEKRVYAGQAGYGMDAAGDTSDGARAIVRAGSTDDPRPLWISIWGGADTWQGADGGKEYASAG